MGRGFESLLDHQRKQRIARNELSAFSSYIGGVIMEFLNDINIVLQIFSNICIVTITLYTAFLQFWHQSIKFLSCTYSMSQFYGETATLQLRNESLAPVSIVAIYMIFNNEKKLLFKEYKPPLLVEGRHSFQVEMEAISQFIPELSEVPLKNRCLFVRFTDGNSISLFCRNGWKEKVTLWCINYNFFRQLKKYSRAELNKLATINTDRKRYKGTCISDSVRFVLLIHEQSHIRTVFINDRGFMSEVCFPNGMWINGVGEGSYEQIKARIDKSFEDMKIKYELYKIEDVMD